MKSRLRLATRITLLLTMMTAVGCQDESPTGPRPALSGIGVWNPEWLGPAQFFAPIVYQTVDGGSRADYITRFAYDGDWNGGNNWDNLYSYPLKAYVYVSVSETDENYFIFYGLFHPRDWCQGWFCDWHWGENYQQHENDLEGAMVTVDKRESSPDWPYGVIVTVETIYHSSTYPAYRNCDFNAYTVQPDPLFRDDWSDCVTWDLSAGGGMEEPPYRFALFVEQRGHGVLMRESPWTGFPGGIGYVYYPGMVPEVPGDGEVSYVLQWLDKSEVWSAPDASLWSKRLTSGGLSTSTYRSLLDGPVGPFDVEYGRRLNCYQQPCGADAPWGQAHEVAESTLVQRGDWHNHPAWAWSRHYDPGPTYNDSAHYPYLWLLSRSDPSVYVGNMFWDPSAAPADNVDHSTTSVGLEPTLGTEESWEMLYPEVVWDFGSHEALPATRAGVASLAQLAVVDTSWGYQGGRAQVAQIQTTGPVVLSMPDRALTSPVYRQAVIRYRATGNATPSLVWSDAAGEHGAPFAVRSQPGGWKVGVLDLTRLGTWSHLTSVTAIGLALDQASGQQAVIDVDFLIVAP